jgi:Family of unknown function (DUF6600)
MRDPKSIPFTRLTKETSMHRMRRILLLPFLLLIALAGGLAQADDDSNWMPTPPRLSYIDGPVSYWRMGAEDWASASINLPLSEGDALYTGQNATLELQIGSRSFVRADESSEVSLLSQDEHFIQFKVTEGLVSFDIRSIAEGDTIEVDTPHAVFTIEHPGYFRLEVDAQTTHLITHRGGQAIVTTPDGRSMSIYPSEDIVVSANNPTMVATYAAPPPDAWDQWNDDRSDRMTESVSARYLPPDVYGAEDLDNYGYWRVLPEYGPVWIPNDVGPDWAPYSTGTWEWDPDYEWTWVDTEPWGWAPFHYGRWVHVGAVWCWAPGPVVRRSVYSPALVAFMVRDHNTSLQFGAGLWWVALGWGEPVVPWWGRSDHRGHPHWDGWGGPRAAFNETNYHYHNADFPRAVLTAPDDKFGRNHFHAVSETNFRHENFAPVHGELPIKPNGFSLYGGAPKGIQPPHDIVSRPVVSTRPQRERSLPWKNAGPQARSQPGPQPKIVKIPSRSEVERNTLPRPPFGPQGGQERAPLPMPPRFGQMRTPNTPPSPPMTTRNQNTEREQAQPRAINVQPSQPVTTRTQPTVRQQTPQRVPSPAPTRQTERVTPRPARPTQVITPPSPSPAIQAPARRETKPRRMQPQATPAQAEVRQPQNVQALPGQPANQMYRGQEQRQYRWDQREGR